MQICTVGITALRCIKEFGPLSAHSSRKFGSTPIMHCNFFLQRVLFDRAINRLPSPCRLRMTPRKKFNAVIHKPASTRVRFVLAFATPTREARSGPFLETECTGGVCGVCFRRRSCPGSILSSRGRRRRHTKYQNQHELVQLLKHRREPLSGVCFFDHAAAVVFVTCGL
jgi:hypothetical protein